MMESSGNLEKSNLKSNRSLQTGRTNFHNIARLTFWIRRCFSRWQIKFSLEPLSKVNFEKIRLSYLNGFKQPGAALSQSDK